MKEETNFFAEYRFRFGFNGKGIVCDISSPPIIRDKEIRLIVKYCLKQLQAMQEGEKQSDALSSTKE